MAIALIDGNNFYAACEQTVDPSLIDQALVVLSNNDGCVIARNAKARCLGILMGQPYFKIRHEIERLNIKVRSSNYALYGDMSQRLMALLEKHCEELEVYSIDEAFAKINRPPNNNLRTWARQLRENIYQDLGLQISIGIGASKGQAKLANHLAKTMPNHAGIYDLGNVKDPETALANVAIEDVWGIGKNIAQWCRARRINNAKQFRDMPSQTIQAKWGVIGIRLQKELQGLSCLSVSNKKIAKQETCVSRSFSKPITEIEELRQAIARYVVLASAKLRKQGQYAGTITVFARTSAFASIFYSRSATTHLDLYSNDTSVLLKSSLGLTERIFHPHHLLMKAGVVMKNLVGDDCLQLHLLERYSPKEASHRKHLMTTIDRLNQRYGNDTVKWAICGTSKKLGPQRKYLSAAATTRLAEIPVVNA